MTYLGFLLLFLAVPLAVLLTITFLDGRKGDKVQGFLGKKASWFSIGAHVLLAVAYTTPWDNYLVATGVWSYNPRLITGLVLGWVPIEEYTFFVLETILTGLWWGFLARRLKHPLEFKPSRRLRIISTIILGILWIGSIYSLISGWKPGTYLSLILVWAIPAIALQLAFGADILWHYRRLVALTILPVFVYLAAADSLAIASGTWTISPEQTLGYSLGALPLEEAVFFLATVIILGFGLTLTLADVSHERRRNWVNVILQKVSPNTKSSGLRTRRWL